MKEYQKITKNMLDFIAKSPSCYHAVRNVKNLLEKACFQELKEAEDWNLEWGRGYFVVRNDSSVIAARLPGINSGKVAVAGIEAGTGSGAGIGNFKRVPYGSLP